MGKIVRFKNEVDEVLSLLEIMTVMKDVSTNRFYVFAAKKKSFKKFFGFLLNFFEMIKNVKFDYPLVQNSFPGVDILMITSEKSFMGQLNGKLSAVTFELYQRYLGARIFCVGAKGADKCRSMGMRVEKTFGFKGVGSSEAVNQIRDFYVGRMLSGQVGKVMVVYAYAKNISLLKTKVVTLLPTADLLREYMAENPDMIPKGADGKNVPIRDFIQETNANSIIRSLAELWLHSQLVEIASDMDLVEAAAQAQQLEAAIEGLSSELRFLRIGLRKAVREKLNQSMREVFTQSKMMVSSSAGAK